MLACVDGWVAACVVATAGCIAGDGLIVLTSDNDAEIEPNLVCSMVTRPSLIAVTTPLTRSPL